MNTKCILDFGEAFHAVLPWEPRGLECDMGQYNRETNEGDLRKGQAEKARLNAEEIPKEELKKKSAKSARGFPTRTNPPAKRWPRCHQSVANLVGAN